MLCARRAPRSPCSQAMPRASSRVTGGCSPRWPSPSPSTLPTLRYYFSGDDFVVLGDIQHRGNVAFVIDTLRMHDVVPNWRPLTGAVYLVEWRLFGLDATMWRLVNLGVHLAISSGVLYALVLRVTRRPAIAGVSALIFGISGAHFDTVSYITALPHVLALFFVLVSLLAMVAYAEDGERDWRAYSWSFARVRAGVPGERRVVRLRARARAGIRRYSRSDGARRRCASCCMRRRSWRWRQAGSASTSRAAASSSSSTDTRGARTSSRTTPCTSHGSPTRRTRSRTMPDALRWAHRGHARGGSTLRGGAWTEDRRRAALRVSC